MGVKASFNNKEYNLIYNSQSGFYEIEIEAPSTGGVYSAEITFEDLIQNIETSTKKIQIWAKEKNTNVSKETLVYFLDKSDLEIKDVIEFEDYEYVIDEETNKNTIFKSKLKPQDKEILFSDLSSVLSETHLKKIWDMLWARWCVYEKLCNL